MPADATMRITSRKSVAAKPARGFVAIHPRARGWLANCGLVHAEDFLALRGEIVSGHHDRHVMRVELRSENQSRIVYLKREHRVGWRIRRRNRLAGFGSVSRSVREAMMLQHLESQALPGPQWLAYGEDGRGRAFLMVDELGDSEELRITANNVWYLPSRRAIAERLGIALADLHAAGITTPDLAAKHVFVQSESGSVTLIDWPSATIGKAVSLEARVLALAHLDASLADALATPRERLRMLRTYLKSQDGLPPLGEWRRRIGRVSKSLKMRASIRDQRCDPAIAANQRLIWLAENEEICVTPGLAEAWPIPAICEPYYPAANDVIHNGERTIIIAPDGRAATLVRWRSVAPLGRMVATLRSKCWRSPATKFARQLFRDERSGLPAAKLLAFGQRLTGPFSAESFVLLRTGAEAC